MKLKNQTIIFSCILFLIISLKKVDAQLQPAFALSNSAFLNSKSATFRCAGVGDPYIENNCFASIDRYLARAYSMDALINPNSAVEKKSYI